ncbi:MAG: M23 family metallopeptidase [Treponema sp.]|nr:M23 family metallopeptidase [Treponema sp.]
MTNNFLTKVISIFLTLILILGTFPASILAQSSPASFSEVKGFNKTVFDNSFSRADREITPEQWLLEARFGLTQSLAAWELIAFNIYEDISQFNEAKDLLEKLGNEELEKRFSQWLLGRFFGAAAEKAMMEISSKFGETQKYYSWHLDESGNIIFDDKTGDPLVIRPGEENREFSRDLQMWRAEAQNHIESSVLHLYPELLAYIPAELRKTMNSLIQNTAAEKSSSIKREFENIAAREERIFSSRRTRDIWSLRSKSENEAARLFTERLIAETEAACKIGIDELNTRIEQAEAGTGDIAIMGEEWLRLYREQFERGLKAWEEAEERFFIRRIEWEQDSFRLFAEGEEMWLAAFNQMEEERQRWELNAKELFQNGEALFKNISEDFERNINEARKEFELNMAMRIGEGTTRVKALIDMYLISASAAISARDSAQFWKDQNNTIEMQKSNDLHDMYMRNALDARDRILLDYAELLGAGALKDILSPDASSEDFFLDEYQIALIRAKALVLYWERKTSIAETVMGYAAELSAGRITEAEGIRNWEAAKTAYNDSLAAYEIELKKLNEAGGNIQQHQEALQNLAAAMQREEEKLFKLNAEYTSLLSASAVNRENYHLMDFNARYNYLADGFRYFGQTGNNSVYYNTLELGLYWGIAEQRETREFILELLESGNILLEEDKNALTEIYRSLETSEQEKNWQNSLDSLSLLFNDYGLIYKTGFFPDIDDIFLSIIAQPGDISQNAVQFITEFENCFYNIPLWLELEIYYWENSFLDYIAVYTQDFSEHDTHWRQYLIDEYILEIDSNLAKATSFKEGLLTDAMFNVSYYQNRVNDAFVLYSQRDNYNASADSSIYYMLYANEASRTAAQLNALQSQYSEILKTAGMFEFSRQDPIEVREQLLAKERELKAQEEAYNTARNLYQIEAGKFFEIGSLYDTQYSVLKKAYETTDFKRYEYEKQDAIQRWAGTSYLGTDNIDLENCKTKLSRAQTVLTVLSDLYGNSETARTYNNPEYDALYSAYEQSFSRKIKILHAAETVMAATAQEYITNQNLFNGWQDSLYHLGEIDQNYIMLRDGRLAFSLDPNINELEEFFTTTFIPEGERFEITLYDESLRALSQRMAEYFADESKFLQWSYARNYLISSLANSNDDLEFLTEYLAGTEEMNALFELQVGTQVDWFITTMKSIGEVIGGNPLFTDTENLFKEAWEGLSTDEKADLEFYIILTLSGNNYNTGFSQMYLYEAYKCAMDFVTDRYWYGRRSKHFLDFGAFNQITDSNYIAMERIGSPMSETENKINLWINGLTQNLFIANKFALDYLNSCQKLDALEGDLTGNIKTGWAEVHQALLASEKFTEAEITELRSFWDLMQEDSILEFNSIAEALISFFNWSANTEEIAKLSFNEYWINAVENQQIDDFLFTTAIDLYIDGTIDISVLRTAANTAYGSNAISQKNHLNNMHSVLKNNLSLYMEQNHDFFFEFDKAGNDLLRLTSYAIESRYLAELSAREVEWRQMIKDVTDKFYEWQNSAALILERGRLDWITGFEKMETSYREWSVNFTNEYERVNNEWAEIYLAGLEDKERWLKQAAEAADNASSESFLSLVGAEAERMSRFIDTREPLGIRNALPQAQSLIIELLQSSGIANLTSAFGSINNIANTAGTTAGRGLGGIQIWNAAIDKAAASDLARKTNAEIAASESRKLAYSARLSADEAVKELERNVEAANQNFRESMDHAFIFNGLWSRSGDNYKKEVVKGSTLFIAVISEIVTVIGYQDYILEPISLQTNLDEYYLATLDSIAVWGLVENVYMEVHTIAAEVFGINENPTPIEGGRQLSPGKFGAHIGYAPNKDDGYGELGRLISQFIHWENIDQKGYAELALPPWEKRMWNDEGSWFKAPSLKDVGSIACSVAAGFASAGLSLIPTIAVSTLIGSASDILFGTLDVAYGYKSFDEAALSVGKSIFSNAVNAASAGIFDGLTTSLTTTFNGSISKVMIETGMKGVQTFTTSFATSAISGITYENGSWGFNKDAINYTNILNSSLVSMAGTFTTSSLRAVNTGTNSSYLKGFNKGNKQDLQNLNGLIGSLAGQGVNYALGNDFTLNVLNLGLLSNNKINSGILELNLGRDGVTMNVGTGGANVSMDNLLSSMRGLQVWNVNSQITNYGKKNDFDALIALRAQYGYGDNVQKDQLWDILKDRTVINTNAEGDYYAQTIIGEDGRRMINLKGYSKDMSAEDQFLLAVVLGHEAYRDGIVTDDNYLETRAATEAHTAMALKMILSGEKVSYDENLANDIAAYMMSVMTGDKDYFNNYVDSNYDSSADYWKLIMQDGVARFEWDGKYTFDLFEELGVEGEINQLDNQTMWLIYNMGHTNMCFDDFRTAISMFDTLNSTALSLENALKADDATKHAADTIAVRGLITNFTNALKGVDSTDLLIRNTANMATHGKSGPQVFANGGGEITTNSGIRAVYWDGKAIFEPHIGWDLGARGSNILVAPMDGTLSLSFTRTGGLEIITSNGNRSISYGHASSSSIKDYISTFATENVRINDNGSLSGVTQNMIIGTMGNTGTYTTASHVHLVYKEGGTAKDPGIFFYDYGNRSAFPVSTGAIAMSGFNNAPNTNKALLSQDQIINMYFFLYNNYNPDTARQKFLSFGAQSNNTTAFINYYAEQQRRPTGSGR